MSWTNGDYEEQATDALRLARLRAFITELNNATGPELAAAGYSRGSSSLVELRRLLEARRKELESLASQAISGGTSFARRGDA